MTINQTELLKALGKLSKAEINQILDSVGESGSDNNIPESGARLIATPAVKDVVKEHDIKNPPPLDLYDSIFASDEQYAQASYDRKMLRLWLERQAVLGNGLCKEIHTTWDGAGYAIYNNWLFGDTEEDNTVELEFINKDGSKKNLKVKVSL
jgi:hypothetical protein